MFSLLTPPVIGVIIFIFALLGSFQLFVWIRGEGKFSDLRERVKAWWYIIGLFSAIFFTTQWCVTLLWMGISFLALREYLFVIPKRLEDQRVRLWLYLSIPVQYFFILNEWYILFLIFIPVYVYLLLPIRMMIVGTTEGFLLAVGSMFWGVMMAGYSLSHVAYLSVFSSEMGFKAGPLGLVLFLLIITEINDASQYMWGKLFGKRKIVPAISPKKTYEGLAGGIVTSIIFSIALAPYLTPMNSLFAVCTGILISLSGFLGDITMSALKRDVKVKDFGTLLPGHGGLLDRIDSLIFTAPLFFHVVHWYYK